MDEKNVKPRWMFPIIWSLLAIAAIVFQKAATSAFNAEDPYRLQHLWNLVKIVIAFVAFFSWNKHLKRVSWFSTPRGENYRSLLPPFIIALLVSSSAAAVYYLSGEQTAADDSSMTKTLIFHYNLKLAAAFSYLMILFLSRRILMFLVRIISGKGENLATGITTGFADGVLIILHLIILIYYQVNVAGIPEDKSLAGLLIRYSILGIVLTGIRVGWGFVPEDRLEIVREFIVFLRERKLWWMTPIFIVLGLLVVLVLLTESTGGSFPFIYAIF